MELDVIGFIDVNRTGNRTAGFNTVDRCVQTHRTCRHRYQFVSHYLNCVSPILRNRTRRCQRHVVHTTRIDPYHGNVVRRSDQRYVVRVVVGRRRIDTRGCHGTTSDNPNATVTRDDTLKDNPIRLGKCHVPGTCDRSVQIRNVRFDLIRVRTDTGHRRDRDHRMVGGGNDVCAIGITTIQQGARGAGDAHRCRRISGCHQATDRDVAISTQCDSAATGINQVAI